MTDTLNARGESLTPRTDCNENTGFIKALAILCMIVDHVAVAFFPQTLELRVIGRMAFPLFAWCLCVGAEYTRNPWKYGLRLLLAGVISQPVYMYAMNHNWNELNIFFELLLGLFALRAMHVNRYGSGVWGPALAIAASCTLKMNYSYGWKGVVFILILYACRKNRASLSAAMAAFCLYWGQGSARLTRLFGVALPAEIPAMPLSAGLLSDVYRVQFWALLALPIIVIPMKKRLRLPKWVSYAAYPGHLAVIALIRHWDEIVLAVSQWL